MGLINNILKAVEKKGKLFFQKFITIDALSFIPPYLTQYISSSCLLLVSFMTSFKTVSKPGVGLVVRVAGLGSYGPEFEPC